MDKISPAVFTLAILAAATAGIVVTSVLMRPQQPIILVFNEATGKMEDASDSLAVGAKSKITHGVDLRTDYPVTRAVRREASLRSNSLPSAPASEPAIQELQAETSQAESSRGAAVQAAPVVYQSKSSVTVQQANQLVVNSFNSRETKAEKSTPQDIDDALSYALEAADPYVKQGFSLREDYWGGALKTKAPKVIAHQLFKGNEYWFWTGTATDHAKISVHIYDAAGDLVEAEAWAQPHFAAARVVAEKTESYYIVVQIDSSPLENTTWALAYGYR